VEVAQPSGRQLVPTQFRSPNHGHRDPAHLDDETIGVGVIKLDTADKRQQINPLRLPTELHHYVIGQEVLLDQPEIAEPEVLQRRHYRLGIHRIDANPDIQVLRVPRVTVSRYGVATDEQELDVTSDEELEELAEFAVQFHQSTHAAHAEALRPWPTAPPADASANISTARHEPSQA
jgi:hypothetical protein